MPPMLYWLPVTEAALEQFSTVPLLSIRPTMPATACVPLIAPDLTWTFATVAPFERRPISAVCSDVEVSIRTFSKVRFFTAASAPLMLAMKPVALLSLPELRIMKFDIVLPLPSITPLKAFPDATLAIREAPAAIMGTSCPLKSRSL